MQAVHFVSRRSLRRTATQQQRMQPCASSPSKVTETSKHRIFSLYWT